MYIYIYINFSKNKKIIKQYNFKYTFYNNILILYYVSFLFKI